MTGSVMDQRIFKMGLSTEAVSLYLLCCSLMDESLRISTKHIEERWTGSSGHLAESLKTLVATGILKPVASDGKTTVYTLQDPDGWKH